MLYENQQSNEKNPLHCDNLTLELNLPYQVKSARLVPDDVKLEIVNSKVTIPEVNGYAIVELSY